MIKNHLNQTLSDIMSSGGDSRITLSEQTGLNKYGCKPYPDYLLNYGSTTSNNISYDSYSNLVTLYNDFVGLSSEENILTKYKYEFSKLRNGIKKFLMLPDDVNQIFGPSGTDLELIILGIGLSSRERKVLNIIISPDEGGSGILESSKGNHFSEFTALGYEVSKGSKLDGFHENSIDTKFIYSWNKNGEKISNEKLYEELISLIDAGHKQNKRVIIHCMYISKLGNIFPSLEQVRRLKTRYNNKIDLVVDACQGRISPKKINEYLNLGSMVLYTGSKFVSGPPFSGVLVINNEIINRVKDNFNIPSDISKYLTLEEWPPELHELIGIKTKAKFNFGLLFRWHSALFEMEKFSFVDLNKSKDIIECFRIEVCRFLSHSKIFSSFDSSESIPNDYRFHPFDFKTLFVLSIKDNEVYETLKFSNYLHEYLGKDLSNDINFKKYERVHYLETKINVGQPVLLNHENFKSGNIRISLNLQIISDLSFMDLNNIKMRFRSELDLIEKKSVIIHREYLKQTL